MEFHIAHATFHLNAPAAFAGLLMSTLASDPLPEPLRAAAQADSATLTPPAHGEYWQGQGGYYICTQPALMGVPARHLVFGKDEAEELAFGPVSDVSGATSHIDGRANTAALLAASKDHAAAKWAAAYTADGHTDFHLPSRLDFVMAHVCAPQLFQKSGWYWSSTQGSAHSAFVQDFEHGHSYWYGKVDEHRVRACRWIPLQPLNA